MNTIEEFPSLLRFEYSVDSNAVLNVAHGVWGGINPQGETEMNFYLESDKLPAYTQREVAPDGSMGEEKSVYDSEKEHVIVRRIHSRILLNYQTARSLVEWLDEKLDALEMEDGGPFAHGISEVQQ